MKLDLERIILGVCCWHISWDGQTFVHTSLGIATH